jgi:hypothetical protein
MRTFLSKTSVVDELAALLASRRSISTQRSGAYRRLALAILDATESLRPVESAKLANTQRVAAA